MSTQFISTPDLVQFLSREEAVLLDVRLEEQFAESHLPRSLNHCVLEVAFEERLQDRAPNKAVVYGVNEESFESRHAGEKLERLDYSGLTPDGIPAAQATIAFDRTVWGSIYGSARFFHRLGMHLLNDLQVRIVAKP